MGRVAKTRNFHHGTIPYGILSMTAYIKKHKKKEIDVSILDLNIAPWNCYKYDELAEHVRKRIREDQPDVIGLSVMYNHVYPYIEKIGRMAKEVNERIAVIAGGACVMAYYEQILLECPSVDAICYSEGEIPVLQLLESEYMPGVFEAHRSFLTHKGLTSGKVPEALFVENLDDIPLVDFSLLELSEYITRHTIFRPSAIPYEVCLPITTTRGCPYNCIFCIAGELHGKKVRKASAKKIIADVREMKERYGMNVLSIEDDQSLIDKERAKEMLKGFAELSLELWMIGGFTLSLIDAETIGLLKRAGLKIATLPIESGSPYVLHEIIDKPIKLEMVPGVVKSLKEEGILCHANIIIGFPGEKEEHRRESAKFIKDSDIDWCYVFCATALKGSRLYDECIASGLVDLSELNPDGYCASNITTDDFTAEEITKKAYLMNLELNFVNNNRFANGDYSIAILYFDHVVKKYPDHAIGHYYLAKCYENLTGHPAEVKYHSDQFREIISRSIEQKEYAEYFNLI